MYEREEKQRSINSNNNSGSKKCTESVWSVYHVDGRDLSRKTGKKSGKNVTEHGKILYNYIAYIFLVADIFARKNIVNDRTHTRWEGAAGVAAQTLHVPGAGMDSDERATLPPAI